MANVSLGQYYEEYAQKMVESGRYASVSEVLRAGLRMLEEKDSLYEAKLEALRNDINKAWEQAENGQLVEWDPQDTLKRAKERLKNGISSNT